MLSVERFQPKVATLSMREAAPVSPPSRKALPPFESLRAFDAVARFGGVRRAAEHLGRDHAVVSRHLRAIEEWVGTKLMERTSSGALLTEDGARYHQEIARAMDSIASATLKLMRGGQKRRLYVRCAQEFALCWLSARLADFERDHCDVDVEVRPTDRNYNGVAHLADIELRFVANYGDPVVVPPGSRVIDVAQVAVICVASRDYLARSMPIRKPRDLLTHQLLREENYDRWRDWFIAHGVVDELDLSGPRLWHGHLALEAARHGRGIALTNEVTVAADLREGRLVEIGHGVDRFASHATGTWQFVARNDRWEAGPVACFRTWLLAALDKDHPHLKSISSG